MTAIPEVQPLQITAAELAGLVGRVIGHSDWHLVAQADANAFGVATRDMQWIHTDPIRAALGPYGRTIAHGYLTLSLATALIAEVVEVSDAALLVNYGIDRVRFPAPLPINAQVRAQITLAEASAFDSGLQVQLHLVYEVRGARKPCCVADILLRYYTEPQLTGAAQ
jgi:acyl dehydratase